MDVLLAIMVVTKYGIYGKSRILVLRRDGGEAGMRPAWLPIYWYCWVCYSASERVYFIFSYVTICMLELRMESYRLNNDKLPVIALLSYFA